MLTRFHNRQQQTRDYRPQGTKRSLCVFPAWAGDTKMNVEYPTSSHMSLKPKLDKLLFLRIKNRVQRESFKFNHMSNLTGYLRIKLLKFQPNRTYGFEKLPFNYSSYHGKITEISYAFLIQCNARH